MRDADTAPFVAMLRDVFGLYPQARALSDGQVAVFFRALAAYSLQQVRAALDAHVRDPERGRWPPVPADVVAQITAAARVDGRPGPEEAWAIALRASDEAATVVWTAEIALALAACRPVLDAGDEVGARMAFREAYSRAVEAARARGVAPAWAASLGHDEQQRERALDSAVQMGLLPAQEAAALLPPPESRRGPPEHVRAMLLELRDRIASQPEAGSWDAAERRRTDALKAAAAARVQAYSAAGGH